MTMAVSVAARNALLQGISDSVTSPARVLRILTGSLPSDPDTQTGTLLAEITLPATPFSTPSAGSMTLSGVWQDLVINATGTAGYFRLVGANTPFYSVHGTVTEAGGGGDMIVDDVDFVAGQSFAVTEFTLTVN